VAVAPRRAAGEAVAGEAVAEAVAVADPAVRSGARSRVVADRLPVAAALETDGASVRAPRAYSQVGFGRATTQMPCWGATRAR